MIFSTRQHGDIHTDVFIAGSGPIGAVYARKCVEAGLRVVMVELGAADSLTSKPKVKVPPQQDNTEISVRAPRSVNFASDQVVVPGYHKKNQIEFQKDIDKFVHVIQGALSTVSVPTSNVHVATLDPASFQNTQDKPFLSLSKNPAQDPFLNLGAEAVTRGVGGMTTHWTCATPRLNPYKELPQLVRDPADNERLWKKLYDEAEYIIGTSTTQFDESIRHNLVLRNLQKLYEGKNRVFKPLPLACHRLPDPDYVEWHATDRILEPLFTDPRLSPLFTLLTNHRCTRVNIDPSIPSPNSHTVRCAEVKCLLPEIEGRDANDSTFYVHANAYVIACGAVGTPQILANSQRTIEPKQRNADPKDRIIETPLTPNLGRYITEQPMTFCQVVLDASLINSVDENPWNLPWWAAKVDAHKERFPEDPIHIPFRDPEPQVTTPFTEDHPWHTQIHRDAFSYGAVAETIDTRLIVDFRFFGYTEPRELNQVIFQDSYDDAYGMPQPTFKFQMSDDDRQRARRMMDDMCSMALKLGGYLPGSEPQFMTPGLALHLAGTVRAGLDEKETVADTYCKVWNFDNLYVAGNGVIPTGFGANPTLTSICYAIRSANQIVENVTAALAAKMN